MPDSLLVKYEHISCNTACAQLKRMGVPEDRTWVLIGHIFRNLDAYECFTEEERETIRTLFREFLELSKSAKTLEEKKLFARDLLAEINQLIRSKAVESLQEERRFIGELLKEVNRQLNLIRSLTEEGNKTLQAINDNQDRIIEAVETKKDRKKILAAVEKSFNEIRTYIINQQETIHNSLDNILELESKTILDPLTNIYNRRYFDQELPNMVNTFLDNKGRVPFSLLLIDLDNFKLINDTHGHQAGDIILKRVAEVMIRKCRAGIDSPIRLGGDEFALTLIGADYKTGSQKARHIQQQLAFTPITINLRDSETAETRHLELKINASIGICQLESSWTDKPVKELLSMSSSCGIDSKNPVLKLSRKIIEGADKALYKAKKTGKNKIVCYNELN